MIESAVRSVLVDLIKAQIMGAIVRNFPFFSGGIPGMIAGYFVGKLANFLVDETIIGAKMLHNEYEVNRQVKNLEEAINESKAEKLTDEEQKAILKKMRDAADSLIGL